MSVLMAGDLPRPVTLFCELKNPGHARPAQLGMRHRRRERGRISLDDRTLFDLLDLHRHISRFEITADGLPKWFFINLRPGRSAANCGQDKK